MLLWQRLSFSKKSWFLAKIFLVSVVVHFVLCFSLLFMYKDYHQKLLIDFTQTVPANVQVRLLSLSASRAGKPTIGTKSASKKSASQKNKKGIELSTKTAPSAPSIPAKVKEKSSSSKTTVTSAKKPSTPTKKTKKLSKKEIVLEKKKAEQAKIAEQKTKAAEKKAEQKKIKQLEEAAKVKKEVEKETARIQEVEAQAKAAETFAQPQSFQAQSSSAEAVEQDIVYVTQQEFDALQIHQKIQDSLFAVWLPPAGIPKTTVAEVLLTVGWDGKLKEATFTTKSNILIYDSAVQEAVEQVEFPREIWGRQFTLIFKP